VQGMAVSAGPEKAAWEKLTGPLGFAGAKDGQRVTAPAGAPPLAGTVIYSGTDKPTLILRLDQPGPGAAFMNTCPMGETVLLSVYLYLYGAKAADVAAKEKPKWDAWLAERFPAAS